MNLLAFSFLGDTPLIICFASYSMLKNIMLGFPILNSFICGSHAMCPLVLFEIITWTREHHVV